MWYIKGKTGSKIAYTNYARALYMFHVLECNEIWWEPSP